MKSGMNAKAGNVKGREESPKNAIKNILLTLKSLSGNNQMSAAQASDFICEQTPRNYFQNTCNTMLDIYIYIHISLNCSHEVRHSEHPHPRFHLRLFFVRFSAPLK